MAGELQDKRRTYTFCVDDTVLDVFGPRIGAYGIAVYTLLARHAKQKEAFPSRKTMEKKLGLSRSSVKRTLATLVEVGLILKTTRISDYGDPSSNIYTLVDLSMYHDHPTLEGGGFSQDPPGFSQDPGVGSHRTQGGFSQTPLLKGSLFKGSQIEGSEDPPLLPPEGEAIPIQGNLPTGKPSRKRHRPNTNYTPGFLRFWETYPHARRAKKPTCLDLWISANLETRTAEVCAKVERLKDTSWKHTELRFIPYTSSWLTDGCYEDDLQPLPPGPHEWAWVKDIAAREASHAGP